MGRIVPWLCLALAVGACDVSPAAEAQALCTTLCRCIASPLPSQQDGCVAECLAEGDFDDISPTCSTCILGHGDSCTSLVRDCVPACMPVEPPVEGVN